MNIPLSPCVPENLVSRDGFSRPVPRQPAHLHTQAESGAYLGDSSRVPRRRVQYDGGMAHPIIILHEVANPKRGLLDRKRSEGYLIFGIIPRFSVLFQKVQGSYCM